MYPRLKINLDRLRQNGLALCGMARDAGIDKLAFVTKVFCADSQMAAVLQQLPICYLADSRLENLRRYPPAAQEKILLRLPMISQAEEVVQEAHISFNSERSVLEALNAAAQRQGKQHKVVLMIDMGDLREGIFFRNEESLLELTSYVEAATNLQLYGAAFNVTCYGSVIPTKETLEAFLVLVRRMEERIGRKLSFVSGGNSSSLYLLDNGAAFRGINNLRLGEALLLGRETAYGKPLPDMADDVAVLEVEIVEIQKKPSYPVGEIGVNAFGERIEYADCGEQLRAIAAAGRQDVDASGLTPADPAIRIVGSSSDHLILDVSRCDTLSVGDTVAFKLDYSALLRSFTSAYVARVYEGGENISSALAPQRHPGSAHTP